MACSAGKTAILGDMLDVIFHGGRTVAPSDELHLVCLVVLVPTAGHPVPFSQRRRTPPLPDRKHRYDQPTSPAELAHGTTSRIQPVRTLSVDACSRMDIPCRDLVFPSRCQVLHPCLLCRRPAALSVALPYSAPARSITSAVASNESAGAEYRRATPEPQTGASPGAR